MGLKRSYEDFFLNALTSLISAVEQHQDQVTERAQLPLAAAASDAHAQHRAHGEGGRYTG